MSGAEIERLAADLIRVIGIVIASTLLCSCPTAYRGNASYVDVIHGSVAGPQTVLDEANAHCRKYGAQANALGPPQVVIPKYPGELPGNRQSRFECVGGQARRTEFDKCTSLGFQAGTPAHGNCILQLRQPVAIARPEAYPSHDYWGYKYPPECRKNLDHLQYVLRKNYDLGYESGKSRSIGYWWNSLKPGAKDVIFIDKSVTDPVMQQRVIQHELCHAEMFRLYGNPYWHKE